MSEVKAGIGGEYYQPYAERTGGESVVFFTRDLSAEGLKKAYAAIQGNLTGKVAVKLHTGEQNGPNIIPRPWVKSLMEQIPNSTIVETNTYYEGDRHTTAQHRETLKINGWTFCPVDIMDEDGVAALPVKDGKWFTEMHVGSHQLNYDSMLVLTHFKGHTMGGFGGSNKNIGIGCADGRIGKAEIHTVVGSVMRPVTDKYKVSRAKLAYIIDATAAPVCIIAPISSWAAAVNSYVPAGSSMSGFEMFVKTIPFNLYAILTLYMVFFTSIVGFDFGLMKKHEENAAKGDLFTSGGEEFQNQETKDPTEGGKYAKGKVIDLIAPMVVMIATAIAAMIWTGHLNGGQNLVEDFANCSSSESLVFAGLVTVGFLLLLYLPRRVIGFKDFMNSVPEGGKLMMPAILILVLAWTLKGMTDALGIGTFVRSAINLNSSLMNFVPLVIFCIAIFIAFSSGTSWGTFAIFVPIVVNMFAELDPTMMIISVAAVLAGAVCGDHISPISDTTIMSSSGAQSNHINHVQTQMQYAFVVIAVCAVGYLIAGFTENWWLTLLCSLVILTGVLLEIRKREMCGR